MAAIALFGAHDVELLALFPIIVIAAIAGWLVSRHYQRAPQKDPRDKNDVA